MQAQKHCFNQQAFETLTKTFEEKCSVDIVGLTDDLTPFGFKLENRFRQKEEAEDEEFDAISVTADEDN